MLIDLGYQIINNTVEEVRYNHTALTDTTLHGKLVEVHPVHQYAAFGTAINSLEQGGVLGRHADELENFPKGCVFDCVE